MQLNIEASTGGTGTVHPGGSILIGSDPGCDIVVPGAADRHAFIRMNADGTLALQDLGSPSGVTVNGTPITGSVSLLGDEQIQIGGATLSLRVTVAPAEPPATAQAPPPPPEAPTAPMTPVAPVAAATPAATPPAAAMPPTSAPSRSGPNLWVMVAIGLAVVAVIAVVVLLLTRSSGDEPQGSPAVVPSQATTPSSEPSPEPSLEPSVEPTETVVTGAQYEGLVDGTYNGKYGFTFAARCKETGPCPVLGKSGATYHFKYSPASHTYSAKATDRGECKGTGPDFPYPIHRAITFRVLSSDELFGTWQAMRLAFKMESSWPEVSRTTGNTRYFCKAGHSTAKWIGTYLT